MSNSLLNNDGEINLLGLVSFFWSKRKRVLKFVFLFFCIGVFIALFSPKEYTSKTIIMPQIAGNKKISGLGGLAAIAGVNLNSESSSIKTDLYPKIVSSSKFKKELLKSKITVKGVDSLVTIKYYYNNIYNPGLLSKIKKYTIGLPSLILKGLRPKSTKNIDTKKSNETDLIFKFTDNERLLFNLIQDQLSVSIDHKNNLVNISFSMPEPLAAAQMTLKSQHLLERFIIDFKIDKLRDNVGFVERRYIEAEKDFKLKQSKLANYKDRNQALVLSRSRLRLRQLEAEYNLAYDMYSQLSKELQSQRIKLKEKTPVFTVLEPVSIPYTSSKPKKIMIVVLWSILGFMISVVLILIKRVLNAIKEE